MTWTREDIELYVSGNFDGDLGALERALSEDTALAAMAAEEARLEVALREAAAAATFCPACNDLVRGMRCETCGAAMQPGGYRVERVLVANAHGRMYVARDRDGQRVALKELAFVQSPSAAATDAFAREATLLRALEHAAIPRFVASFTEGEGVHARYYLAQDLVDGAPLDADLEAHFWREDEIVALARAVLDVMVYLQSVSPMVIHRDIKPANLVRRPDGSIAVVDFGAAHVAGATQGSTTVGTFGYMPLEQLAGVVDATTDVYALGATLVHLLTRQEPWKVMQSPDLAMNVSAPVRAWLAKATAADPTQRFSDAKAALAGLDAPATLALAPTPRRRWPPKRAAVVGAAALALAGGGVAAFELRGRSSPADAAATAASKHASSVASRLALGQGALHFDFPVASRASEPYSLAVDGLEVERVLHDDEFVNLTIGTHDVLLVDRAGQHCRSRVVVVPGSPTEFNWCTSWRDAPAPAAAPEPRLPPGPTMDFTFDRVALPAAVRTMAARCGWSAVIPSGLDARVSTTLKAVPCDQALETVLAAHGLWYEYQPTGKLLRIASRTRLDAEHEAELRRRELRRARGVSDDALPAGPMLDLDFDAAPLRKVVGLLAQAIAMNVVVPEDLDDAVVTVQLKHVPWSVAMQAVLASQGLWYRYNPNGKILRVAPRTRLDAEDEASLRRMQMDTP